MSMFKRMIAAILVAAMMVSELPTAALAAMLDDAVTEEVVMEEALVESSASEPEDTDLPEPSVTETEGTMVSASEQPNNGEAGDVECSDEPAEEPEAGFDTDLEAPVASEEGAVEPEVTPDEEIGVEEEVSPSEGAQDALEWDLDGDGLLTITGTGPMGQTPWSEYMESVTTVLIGEGVTSICEAAFDGASNLSMVLLPNSLESIGAYAFEECTALTEIFIPAGVTQIGRGAFQGCGSLRVLQIFGYDVTIEEDAFSGVTAEVYYPSDAGWCDGSSYGGTLTWYNSSRILGTGLYNTTRWLVQEYGMLQLLGTGTLEDQTSAAEYPWYTYMDSINMVNAAGVENVPKYAFAGYKSLNNVYFYNVSSIGAGAFSGCSNLTELSFESCVPEIAADAFTGVTANVNYLVSDGWTESQMLDYGGHLNWMEVYDGYYGDGIYWSLQGNSLAIYSTTGATEVMEDQTSAAGYPWYAHRDRIVTVYVSNVTVGDYAFDGYTNLISFDTYTMTTIGTCAFRGCSALESITLGGEPPVIAEDAFTGVTAQVNYNSYYAWTSDHFQDYGGDLTWCEIIYEDPETASGTHGDNVSWSLSSSGILTITGEGEMVNGTSAEDYGWYGFRDQIWQVTVSGVTSVGDYAFAGYPNLVSLEIQESVTKIGSHILDGSNAVNDITFNGMPPSFAEDAFAGLSDAILRYPYRHREQWQTTIESTYGGTNLGWSMLTVAIAQGVIPGGAWAIQETGSMSFYPQQVGSTFAIGDMEPGAAPWSAYADSITSLHMDGVSAIGANAFAGCTALTYVSIPETATVIGDQAFAGCTTLTEIQFNGTANTIGENAFRDVTANAYYYTDWDSAMLQNYGGTLTWEKSKKWVNGGSIDGSDMTATIYWQLYSDGSLILHAENQTPMSAAGSAAADYPWHSYADQITKISLNNISSIADYAFAGCTGLTGFLFDINITKLGNYIFDGCSSLSSLTFHGSAPEFSENTFFGVTATVEYPTADVSWTADKLQDYGGNLTWLNEEIDNICGENLTWALGDDGTLIISGTGAMTDYEYEGAPWYADRRKILSIEISDGVTTIGSYAFEDCSALTTVTIPDSVTVIGAHAFGACCELTAVTIPAGVTSLEPQVFSGCVKLTSITIPEGVTGIGSAAFMSCFGLTSVTIPGSVKAIDSWAFYGCTSLTDITMAGDAPTIAEDAFDGVTATIHYPAGNVTWTEDVMQQYGGTITWVAADSGEQLPGGTCGENLTWTLSEEGVLTISGTGAMEDYTSGGAPWYEYKDQILRVEIREGATTIGNFAFGDCAVLTDISISDSVTSVGNAAFSNCSAVETVMLPEGVTNIGGSAFSYCTSLTGITIPDSVTSMSSFTFYNCESLKEITIPGSVPSVTNYMFGNCTSLTSVTLEEGIKTIILLAFDNCTSLKEITIPGSVVSVGEQAFKGCTGLTSVVMQEGVESIGAKAFTGCGSLANVSIPDSVISIGNEAFCYCRSLTSVVIPDSVTSLGESAFSYCESLTSVTLGQGIDTISKGLFNNCRALTEIEIPDSVTSIGANAFYDCAALTSVTLADSITEIGEAAFSGCWKLQNITIPERMTGIANNLFAFCSSLTSVEIPDSVTSIGDRAFVSCSGLEDITIPGSVTSLGDYVFGWCDSLTSITMEGNAPAIADNALYGVTATVFYPAFNTTWTDAVKQNYGGTITWTAVSDRSGTCGENLTWLLSPDGTLTISGTGAMETYSLDYTPWSEYRDSITRLVLEEGITNIGEAAFYGCTGLTSVAFPDSLTYIGGCAFMSCTGLTGTVVIPASVTTIGSNVFHLDSGITHVRFERVDCPAIENNSLGTLSGLKSIYVPGENYASYEALLSGLSGKVAIQTDWEYFPVENLETDSVYSRTAVLYWDAHRSGEVAGYTIFRDDVEIGRTTECSYTDRSLEPETTYSYTVRAYFDDGSVTPESESVSVQTVLPEISGLSGYVEYANIKKFADICNTIQVTILDKGNLAALGNQKHTLGLYYSNGGDETLIGWAECVDPRSIGDTSNYALQWDVSILSDGEYTLRAVLTDVDGTTAEWTETVQVDNTAPAKLLQLAVTGSEQYIDLSWAQAQEYDSIGYHIYRSVGSRDNFQLLAEIDSRETLTYQDTTADETEICYYYVVAVDIFGREAAEYEIIGGSRIADTVKPRVVQLLPASGTYLTGTVAFAVKAEDNVAVTGTKVEYSADQEATWTELTAQDKKYTLDTTAIEADKITVRAYAYDAAGNASDAFTQTYAIDNQGPEQVTGLSHVSTSVTLTLSWQDVADQDIGGFQVEQLQSDGTWKVIAGNVTALGHNLRGLMPDTAYTFRVTAYDIFGNMGTVSEEYTAVTAADTTAPVTAQLLPASGTFSEKLALSATVEDDYSIASAVLEYSVDNLSWTQISAESYTGIAAVRKISAELDLAEIPEGLLYVRAVATDLAGNTTTETSFVQHMVDKTAPAAPSGVTATGCSGYVEISWSRDVDVKYYQIYRAEAEDGEFVLLTENHASLNYFDRSVEDGAVYYYQVAAVDAAGNVGQRCETVSAQASEDTQAPEILSIAPVSGNTLGRSYAQVSVLAKDNSSLNSVLLEYSHDGESYVTLTRMQDIAAYGTTVSGRIPIAEFSHGDTVYLRITASDYAGNICDAVQATYTIDTQAPAVSEVTAVYSEETVIVSWTGGAEEDLAGYRIYRRDSSGTANLIGQLAAVAGQSAYTWTDDELPISGGTFLYLVEAVDAVGNTATGSSSSGEVPGQETVSGVVVPQRTGPKALLSCDSVMTMGVEYIIDGSGSSDDGQIISYSYDFGDGTTATGKSPIHTYTAEGTYIISLTVTDDDAQTHTVSKRVKVKAPNLVGNVQVRIVDEKGAPVPNAPVYFDLGEESQVIRGTDASGYASFTAEVGRHTVGCVILNNQWLPVKRDLIVNAGETTSVSMTLINKPIVEGTFEIKRMTLEEIEAAGIDLTDPENQYYVEVVLHLEYENAELTQTIPGSVLGGGGGGIIFDPSGKYKPKKKDDDDPGPIIITPDDPDPDDDDVRGWYVELIDKSEDPKLMILDIPIGIQSLKEMFDVRLHILNNASSEFSMLDNVITLDTPSGLSVVTDAYMKSQKTANVAEIKGGTQETIEWIVRGDQPGEYMLAADYSGILSQFNEPLTARFEAQDPIQVYGMSGLSLIIEVAEELENGTLYYNVILENNGKEDIYKPVISTDDILIEMQLYDAVGQLKAEGTDESISGINMDAIEALLGDMAKENAFKTISSLPDVLAVGNKLIMYYMCIDQTEYTHCVMELTEKTYDIGNTYGLEDIYIFEKPLDYFRQSMNTQVNSQEKADLTFTTNKDAYNQLIKNNNYAYWIMANDKKSEFDLSDNADEVMWDLLKGDFAKAATDNEDGEQVKAMLIDLLSMTAESVDDVKYTKQLNFLKAVREVVDGMSLSDVMGDYADSFKKALDSAYEELKDRGSLYKTGYSYALEDLIYEHWKTWMEDGELKVLDKASSFVKLQKILADKDSEKVWKNIGLSIKAIKKVQELTENVLLDVEWILEAQAKEDAMLVCLNAMINNFTLSTHINYQDSDDVLRCLIDMKEMLETEGIAYAIISNLVDLIVDIGIEHLVGKGTDVVMEMVGGAGDPLTYFIIKTVNLTAAGIDMLTNLSEQQDMADHIRFAAMLSDSARSAVINARNVYKNNKTPENAVRYMQLLKLLINLRALGESQVALYGKSFETDFTVGNLPLLKVVRAKTDAKKATSWYQWRDIVEDRISELRVRLLRNPLSMEITGRERPTVSFDYSCGQTLQSFDDTFEYSLDKGENWLPCDGGPIAVEAPEISVELWVRKIDSSNTDMTETGSVTIYGPLSVDAAEMEVLKTPEGYRIEGLNPDKTYQVTFSASPMDYSYDTVLETTLPQGSYSYSYNTDDVYNYVYIRVAADQNGYMSEIAQLGIVSTVNLNVFVTGEGLVMDHETVWEYGSQVSVTAVPAENRIFDGWYRSGAKVSSSLTYTFNIYSSVYLEARFVTLDDIDLPGASGDVDPITGTGSATTEDGTTVTVSGAPEMAAKLVVETEMNEETENKIAEALAEIGNPVQVYEIYFVDLENVREEADGVTITLDYSGDTEDLILCGISGDYVASVLPAAIEDGQITFTGDGSAQYVLVQLPDRYISLETDTFSLMPGQKANLSAQFLPGNPTGTKIQWSLAEGDDMYATLKVNGDSAVLTALTATGSRSVIVTASAADGSFPSTSVEILVVPYVHQLTLHTEEADVTGQKIKFDVNREEMLELTAVVAPVDAVQKVEWSTSNESIAEVTEGLVSFTGETGTVKITADATDGSKKSASVTIQVVALTQKVAMAEGSVTGLVGGGKASFKAVDAVTGAELTKSQITWSLGEDDEPYASITAAGVLTTREVEEQTNITVIGRVVGNEEVGVVEHKVTIYPKAVTVELWHEDTVVNGKTILVDTAQGTEEDLPAVELEALVYPGDAMETVTWKSQNPGIADVDENGVVTVKWDAAKQICKSGTVTITATAADGSKAAASVKLNFGVFVQKINLEAPDLELRSGEKMTISAEPVPANPTKTGVTWSFGGEEDANYATISASGKLTAKTVYDEHTVTVVATAKDGSGVTAEIPVLIRPKTDGILTLYSGEQNVTKSIVSVDLNDTGKITLSAHTLGDYLTENVTWKSSSKTVASLEDHGDGTATVTMLRTGGTSITATAEDGRTATVTLKGIRMVSDITVTAKTGDLTVASGKSLTLKAAVEPANATSKTVLWSVAEADAAYATINSSGKLTAAKNLLEARTITVHCKAKDGGVQTSVQVTLRPLASGVSLFLDSGEAVSNTTMIHNMADSEELQLTAKVYPLNQAEDSVTWKSSNKKIADIDQNGMITCLKAGTVTITATANDGSKEKATFKLKVEKWMTELTLPDTAVIAGGKTLTMTKLQDYFVDPDATNKTLIWTMEGEGAAFATLSNKGVLKTGKVTEPKTLTVTATAADDGGASAQCVVTIYPITTKVQVLHEGEIVTGKTLTLTERESLTLEGTSLPVSAADAYTWKSSSVKYAEVDENGTVTAVKAGKTVSISCVAADGSGKSAVVKIKIVAAE